MEGGKKKESCDRRVLAREIVDTGAGHQLMLQDALALVRAGESALADSDRKARTAAWQFEGPPVTVDFLQAVLVGPGALVAYHLEWARLSGVPSASAQCHEHRNNVGIIGLALSADQVQVAGLACIEQLVRRTIQLEMAVERNPRHPDFSGLSVIVDGPVTATGAVRAPKFANWVADRQKERSQVLKQRRLYGEEQAAQNKAE